MISAPNLLRLTAVLLLALLIAGCAGREDPTLGWSASQLYGEAKNALNEGNYDQAVEYYEKLEARYPFGRYAQQAQIEIPYAYYKAREPEAAIAAVDRFIQLNPRHPNLDYAYYLRGLINFNRHQGFLTNLFPRDPAEMDPEPFEQSFQDFDRLIREFPDSRYAQDSYLRMVYIRNALAAYELRVAEFYMERTAWVAGAERARHLLATYPGAEVQPQALGVLWRAYSELGLDDYADATMMVLELNYPDAAAAVRAGEPIEIREPRGGLWRVFDRLPFFTN
ncbi:MULTISPECIES: outer membrane protein assembly factor BamD [unclassified Thioalkalivibrio]|uniref:outer membrane protein assembly factor BamD n=1 Tax=unclassified Thioalkalivibrio TaxID=2621013 RepID=UPI000369F3F2|nr:MULTISPECIES: outer membrane protein assembly factor BamD [unclassified Thioalkalivibrio]